MRQESNFRPNVVSPAGAVGLMQVLPTTANAMSRVNGVSSANLFDPYSNIEHGQSFIEAMRRSGATQGQLPKIIAAYNAGPLPVARWSYMAPADPLLWIESIPYWETRYYVPAVFRTSLGLSGPGECRDADAERARATPLAGVSDRPDQSCRFDSDQAGWGSPDLQLHLGVQKLRYRTVLLRILGQLAELRLVQRHFAGKRQVRTRDLESVAVLLELHASLCFQRSLRHARLRQPKRQGHGERRHALERPRSARIGAGLVLETGQNP